MAQWLKSTWCQAWEPEFKTWTYMEEEMQIQTIARCPLHVYCDMFAHTYIYNEWMNVLKQ